MTLSPPPCSTEELERLVAERTAERTADLAELLGHVAGSWDDERRRMARRLHDSMGSSMTALNMHLALLIQQMPHEKALQERGGQMKKLLTVIIDANREMQTSLWNDKLEFLGVKAALRELTADFAATHRLTVRLSLPDEDCAYPREQGVALLRSVEEGLRNVAAHAQASEVEVILDDDGEHIVLTVRDNGIGPGIADMAPQCCHGLRLLRERAAYLGGSMRLRPGDAGGTTLTVTLPRAALPGA